jgi:subtilase family serine protease
MFRAENDMGPVEGSLKLENISLTFKLTQSQQAALTALLDQLQNPASPNFHKWLTPEQYADRFGLSQNDINQVAAWLEAQGFTVTQTARSRTWVSFSGTAAQVQAAFQTEIHNFSLNGETYYANATEPSVPSALADVVLGIRGLDNYRLKPRSVVRRVKSSLQPDFTSYLSGNTYVAPGDFAVIYDVNALYASGIDGTGQSIAVMGQTDLYNSGSDITAFRAAAELPAKSPTLLLVSSDPGLSSTDIVEASLDVEWSGAVAKNATIIYVYSTDVNTSLTYAIDNDTAPVISISYGNCEANWGSTNLTALEELAEEANTQGQTIVAAAGDSGAADCDYSTSTTTVTSATHGLAVDAPASVPYVTGMGGTEFNEGSGTYWETATTSDVLTSALSYIPEMVWNDTSNSLNTSGQLAAGGGGASAFFPKPTWQTGTGVPNDGQRDVPDLSLNASPFHDGYLICVQGSCVNGFRESNNDLSVVGGTSAAAPTFAGIVALINQHVKSTPPGQGNINPILYSMAGTSPTAFHDITVGNNIVPCTEGTTDCPTTAPFQIGYSAGVGYDQASGLGSVDAYNLVTMWNSSVSGSLAAPVLTVPSTGATGVSTTSTFSWTTVTGNAGYWIMIATSSAVLPTSPTVVTCSGCALTTTTSAASYTPVAGALAASTTYYWQVQALSSASGVYGTWSIPSSFTTGSADFQIAASSSSLTVTPGGAGLDTITATAINGFSGSVALTCSVSSGLAGVTCSLNPTSIGTVSGSTLTITAASSASNFPALPRSPRYGGWGVTSVAMLCLLLIAVYRLRHRGLRAPVWNLRHVAAGAVLAALLAAGLISGGCSSSSTSSTGPPESGTVTVQGVGPSTTHSVSISVTVS